MFLANNTGHNIMINPMMRNGSQYTHSARLSALDGWRGLAILGVLFDHFVTKSGINLGRFGVELFFVLSGRLMAEILFVQKMPLNVFFLRRFSRVYPALFVFVLGSGLIIATR
jgi:peptidoglycan/LPS O-acetylase OafA/YrhL